MTKKASYPITLTKLSGIFYVKHLRILFFYEYCIRKLAADKSRIN